jgi:ABC-type sulfate transport system permease component
MVVLKIILYILAISALIIAIVNIRQFSKLLKEFPTIQYDDNKSHENINTSLRCGKIACISSAIFGLCLLLTDKI